MSQDSTGTGPQFREVGNGCRIIDVSPSDVRDGRLQLIDAAVAGRSGEDNSSRVTSCLKPGRYRQPITLRERHSHLAPRGYSEAAVISADPRFKTALGQGLIVLIGANNVTITGLQLELPQVPAALARGRASHLQDKAFAATVNAIAANRYVSIGIRPLHSAVMVIGDCLFPFTFGAEVTTPGGPPAPLGAVFGVGILAASDWVGLQLERNRFLCDPALRIAEGPQHPLAGYLLTQNAAARTSRNNAFRQFNGSQVGALLHNAVIRDNTFDRISAGVVVLADLGTIRIWDNVIRRSYAGIWPTDATAAALTDLGAAFGVSGELKDQAGAVRAANATGLLDPVPLLQNVFGRTFPPPDLDAMELAASAVHAADTEKLQVAGEQPRQGWMTRFVNDVTAGLTPARPWRRRTAKATPLDATTAATADFNHGIVSEEALLTQGSPFLQYLLVAHAGLAALGRLGDTPAQSELTLRIERNGNMVSTTNAAATTLAVAASPHVAITGNVLTGTSGLLRTDHPPRRSTAGSQVNTVV